MGAEYYAARRRTRAAEIAALRDRVSHLMRDGVERYSVDVAKALGFAISLHWRMCPQIAYALSRLERERLLTSRHVAAPHSGNGRRYYKLAARG